MILNRARTALDALLQLGPRRLAELAVYRLGLHSGHYRRLTPSHPAQRPTGSIHLQAGPALPSPEQLAHVLGSQAELLTAEANEIINGKVRLFGGAPVPLSLEPPGPARHWTDYETGRAAYGVEDIKFTWEPARFGWAVVLSRATRLTGHPGYAQSFSRYLSSFLDANPAYMGANWTSAQEAAIRLICLGFSARVMGSQPEYAGIIAAHAERILPTLPYARAQNNNHLLSEAVGLYTAAALLPQHPQAARWREAGWKWMNYCFENQFAADGTYIQHSTNYHRLALQLALWAISLARSQGQDLPALSQKRLAAGTLWLLERTDPISGRVPNLGHNDGAYILPLACGGFEDYRPTIQAASRAFLGKSALPPGPWDEMSLWFGCQEPRWTGQEETPLQSSSHLVLRQPESWASLRAVQFTSRPGQADLLHVDVWWRGEPVSLDPGTYQYNAAPPWENALAGTAVHNTVTVEEQDQMRRAGRFMWLDWPKVSIQPQQAGEQALTASHNGYHKRFKVVHRRSLKASGQGCWLVEDTLLNAGTQRELSFTLHWLLPDAGWQLEGQTLSLDLPHGRIQVEVTTRPANQPAAVQVIRAGQVLAGSPGASPILGWYSPTYGVKMPALAFRCTWVIVPPLVISTRFVLGY